MLSTKATKQRYILRNQYIKKRVKARLFIG